MISLQRRLRLSLAVGLVSFMGIVWVVGDYSIRGLTEETVAVRLQREAEGLVGALELGPAGIRVNSVNPTVTMTPMGKMAWGDPKKSQPVLARIVDMSRVSLIIMLMITYVAVGILTLNGMLMSAS